VETTQETTKKPITLLPLPGVTDAVQQQGVGHVGIYNIEEEDEEPVEALPETINTLGKTGTTIMLACEAGIKTTAAALAKDRDNGIPNSLTGIFIHYFCKGIKNDFNISFTDLPVSIKPKDNPVAKAVKQGKRIITKAQKNEIVAQCGWDYWSFQVSSGSLSVEEAQRKMLESINKRTELEEEGVYFDKNKTAGVKTFDWKAVVEGSVAAADAAMIYSGNKIEIVVPDLMESYYSGAFSGNRKFITEGIKSVVLFPTLVSLAWNSGIKKFGQAGQNNPYGGPGEEVISSIDDLIEFLDIKRQLQGCQINAVHLVKNKIISSKERYVCFDVIDAKENRVLKLFGKDSLTTTIYRK
jgi:hypothetical protein